MSCLSRCPYFRGVLNEGFHCNTCTILPQLVCYMQENLPFLSTNLQQILHVVLPQLMKWCVHRIPNTGDVPKKIAGLKKYSAQLTSDAPLVSDKASMISSVAKTVSFVGVFGVRPLAFSPVLPTTSSELSADQRPLFPPPCERCASLESWTRNRQHLYPVPLT